MTLSTPLKGKALIAMPQLKDPYFSQSVCYICQHDHEGTLGFIINKPIEMLERDLLLDQRFDVDKNEFQQPLLNGGPMHTDRGFVIHTNLKPWKNTLHIDASHRVTTSQEILSAIAHHEMTQEYLILLGYASWEPGQLETELKDNYWLICELDPELLFTVPFTERWSLAIQRLGIHNLANLIHVEGHA